MRFHLYAPSLHWSSLRRASHSPIVQLRDLSIDRFHCDHRLISVVVVQPNKYLRFKNIASTLKVFVMREMKKGKRISNFRFWPRNLRLTRESVCEHKEAWNKVVSLVYATVQTFIKIVAFPKYFHANEACNICVAGIFLYYLTIPILKIGSEVQYFIIRFWFQAWNMWGTQKVSGAAIRCSKLLWWFQRA